MYVLVCLKNNPCNYNSNENTAFSTTLPDKSNILHNLFWVFICMLHFSSKRYGRLTFYKNYFIVSFFFYEIRPSITMQSQVCSFCKLLQKVVDWILQHRLWYAFMRTGHLYTGSNQVRQPHKHLASTCVAG